MAYAARTDVETVFGKENVKKWADLENNGVDADVTARIAAALTFAEDDINSRLRGGPYAIPLDTPVEVLIVDVTAKIAGVWLYESRGVQDVNPDTGAPLHKLWWHKNDAGRTIRDIVSGKRRLAIIDTDKTFIGTPEVVVE